MWWWGVLLLCGVGAGVCLVAYLVADPPLHRLYALAGGLLVAFAGVAVAFLATFQGSGGVAAIAAAAVVAALVGGYWLAASYLPSLAPSSIAAPLERVTTSEPRTAILAVVCAEATRYHLPSTLREIAALQQAAETEVPAGALPFLLASERARYGTAGGSDARPSVRRLLDAVCERLPETVLPPVASWCAGEPTPEQALAHLVEAGSTRVVVLPLAVAPSVPMLQTLDRLSEMRTAAAGVQLVDMPYLDDLAPLDEHIADLVADVVGESDRSDIGAVLVGSGQPPEWDRAYPEGPDEETAFMQRVRLAMSERGFDAERIRLAWAEWREPDVADGVRHLAALGCPRVVVVPACEPFPTLSTALDIPHAIELARVDSDVRVELLPAWADEDLAGMIASAIERTIAESES